MDDTHHPYTLLSHLLENAVQNEIRGQNPKRCVMFKIVFKKNKTKFNYKKNIENNFSRFFSLECSEAYEKKIIKIGANKQRS